MSPRSPLYIFFRVITIVRRSTSTMLSPFRRITIRKVKGQCCIFRQKTPKKSDTGSDILMSMIQILEKWCRNAQSLRLPSSLKVEARSQDSCNYWVLENSHEKWKLWYLSLVRSGSAQRYSFLNSFMISKIPALSFLRFGWAESAFSYWRFVKKPESMCYRLWSASSQAAQKSTIRMWVWNYSECLHVSTFLTCHNCQMWNDSYKSRIFAA